MKEKIEMLEKSLAANAEEFRLPRPVPPGAFKKIIHATFSGCFQFLVGSAKRFVM